MNAPPVFVIGISQRSGTNFLASLLRCHPDLSGPAAPLQEDMLLRHADLVQAYVTATGREWPRDWGDSTDAQRALLAGLGQGILGFLNQWAGGRAVTKSPFTDNLELYPMLFGEAPLVILVRDGRSVVESLIKGFGAFEDEAIRQWRRGARHILAFRDRHPESGGNPRYTIVRYEDLVSDLESGMTKVLAACDLDPATFDWERARSLPLLGSSFAAQGTQGASVSWEPQPRPDGFDPEARFEHWTAGRRARFEWLAGDEQRALGYRSEASSGSLARQRILDAVWPLRISARRAKGTAVVRGGALKRRISADE
ncbi:MAG: protein-tyrosine sulfotransferase [Actinomycetota bacterium]|nr:protein-tyrosine sulfotransferase [Actinomycetota bacterium]